MRYVVIFPVLALYVYIRALIPLDLGRRKLICAALLLPGALFASITRFVGGSMVAPELPRLVMIVGDFCALSLLMLALLVLIRDLISVFLRIFGIPLNRLARVRSLTLALAAISVGLTAYGEYVALDDVRVREVDVAIDNLPAGLDGMTIAQLSDLHVSSLLQAPQLERIVHMTNALHPDLIVITGDMVDGDVVSRGAQLQPLQNLQAKLGVWGCEGNHEHYVDYNGWRTFLPTLGIGMLYNSHVVLERNASRFVLAGLTDPMAERYHRELPDYRKAVKGAPSGKFVLALEHQPKIAARLAKQGAGLVLTGHTHGGQAPLMAEITELLNHGYVKGLYYVDRGYNDLRMPLYVNQGTHLWNGFPLRLGTYGEITLIRLRCASGAPEQAKNTLENK